MRAKWNFEIYWKFSLVRLNLNFVLLCFLISLFSSLFKILIDGKKFLSEEIIDIRFECLVFKMENEGFSMSSIFFGKTQDINNFKIAINKLT